MAERFQQIKDTKKMEDGRWKLEVRGWKMEVGRWKLEVGCWVLHFDSAQCDRCWVLGAGGCTSTPLSVTGAGCWVMDFTLHYLLFTLHASLKNLQRPNNIVLGNDMVVSIAQIYQHRVVIFMNQF